jgi:DNA topoisomerase-6 subunit B
MVIFVHMASVWVPFTSESKEAIADYDEIQKEITLALRECGRRLGLFLRRRERAASEFRRRNIFELYIEEVVEACNRLKGGHLPKEKLKAQLQKIATSRTGGLKTDETLGKTGAGPEGLPHSIIVTSEGLEGEVEVASHADPGQPVAVAEEPPREQEVPRPPKQSRQSPTAARRPASGSRKANQMALFEKSEKPPSKTRSTRGPARRGKK